MKENNKFINWVKAHKTELIIAGVTIAGTILVTKNWSSIKKLYKTIEPSIPDLVQVEPIAENIAAPSSISSDILENLTGNKMTARALGNKVWCSAQTINKRIVGSGLATKLPNGEYMMTDTGRLFGVDTWKTTSAGHSFSNIEWDEKILDIIFSPEELTEIAAKQNRAAEILAA